MLAVSEERAEFVAEAVGKHSLLQKVSQAVKAITVE